MRFYAFISIILRIISISFALSNKKYFILKRPVIWIESFNYPFTLIFMQTSMFMLPSCTFRYLPLPSLFVLKNFFGLQRNKKRIASSKTMR